LLLILTNALKSAPKCNPLTLRCRCSNIHKTVCGESGKTHANACIANCFNDKIKHEGACTNQCQSSKQTCKYEPFGTGRRLKCCDKVEVCFGKTCTVSAKNCKWKGAVITEKREGNCFWKKRKSNKYQRICCRWQKICKGSCKKGTRRCYSTLKRCKWTGRLITTKRNRRCSHVNTVNGKRKRCCTFTHKCINFDRLSCKSKRAPRCWANRKCKFVGPFIKKKCSRKCENVPVGRFGKRRKCCINCRRCASFKYTLTPKKRPDVCETKLKKCHWKGHVVVIRKHKKCSVRHFGIYQDRKRCCSWKVRCVGKHCKIVHKRCRWVGCIIKFTRKKECRIRMKNNHQKQKFCCKWNKKCCGSKCRDYNQKCRWRGKVFTTRHHWKCSFIRIGQFGRKKKMLQTY